MKTIRNIIIILASLAALLLAESQAIAQSTLPAGGTGWSTSTKGDLLVGTSSLVRYSRLPIGTAGTVLRSSSTAPFGMEWAAVSGSGTVTSVAATVPTGLTISGSPITTAGTLALALQAGYVIPLTASTTEWATAFGSTTALTPAYIRGLFSNSATGLTYNSSTGATSLTGGFLIPLSASTTNWESFYVTPSTRITAGTNLSWSGNTLNASGGAGTLTLLVGNGFLNTATSSDAIKAASFVGTSTTPSTFINASSTNQTVSGILYLPGVSNGCLQVASGIASSTGVNCGSSSGATSVGSAGFIQFASSTAGFFNASSSFYYDNARNRLGVGTSSPMATLDVYDTSGTGCAPSFRLGGNAGGDWDAFMCRFTNNDGLPGGDYISFGNGSTSASSSMLTVDLGSGNIGMGTTTSPYKLSAIGPAEIQGNLIVGDQYVSPQLSALGTGIHFVQFATSTNDINGLVLTNMSGGSFAGTGITLKNGSTTQGVAGLSQSYFCGTYMAGGNFNGAGIGITGLSKNDMGSFCSDGSLYFSAGTTTGQIGFNAGSSGLTSTARDMILISNGNLGIGSTTPISRLTVQGSTSAPTADIFVIASSTGSLVFRVGALGSTTIPNLASCATNLITDASGSLYCGAGGSGSGTVNSGLANQVAYYSANGTAVSGTSTITIVGNQVGISTTTPTAGTKLDVFGNLNVGTSSTPMFFVNTATNMVGIATSTGAYDLNIASARTGGAGLNVKETSNGTGAFAGLNMINNGGNSATNFLTSSGYTSIPEIGASSFGQYADGPGGITFMANNATAPMKFVTGGQLVGNERMRITGAGNIGIGSTTPNALLVVQGTTTAPTAALLDVASSSGSSIIRVTSTSRVGIGSSSPNYQLSVSGTVAMPGLTTSSGLQTGVVCTGAGGELINDSVACLASSKRFKNDIKPLMSSLDEVLQMNPVSYFYKPEFNGALQSNPNYNGEQVGFVAEEMQKIDPRLTVVETSGDHKGEVHSVRYENMTAVLAGAIKELNAKIGTAKRSVEENWQWIFIGILILWVIRLEFKLKINKK